MNCIDDSGKPLIIIYCREWCNYLQKTANLFHNRDWAFTFVNLQFDPQKAQDLLSALGNPLILPVLEIDGVLYEKPNYKELKKYFATRESLKPKRKRTHG